MYIQLRNCVMSLCRAVFKLLEKNNLKCLQNEKSFIDLCLFNIYEELTDHELR